LPGIPEGEDWKLVSADRSLAKMGHAAKHLKDFQEIDPSLTDDAVAKILTFVKERFPGTLGAFGATEHVGMVRIADRRVTVKVVVSPSGVIKTGFPLS